MTSLERNDLDFVIIEAEDIFFLIQEKSSLSGACESNLINDKYVIFEGSSMTDQNTCIASIFVFDMESNTHSNLLFATKKRVLGGEKVDTKGYYNTLQTSKAIDIYFFFLIFFLMFSLTLCVRLSLFYL